MGLNPRISPVFLSVHEKNTRNLFVLQTHYQQITTFLKSPYFTEKQKTRLAIDFDVDRQKQT